MLVKIVAKFIIFIFHPQKWYKAAFTITKYYSYIFNEHKKKFKINFSIVHSSKLDNLLLAIDENSKSASDFPILLKLNCDELLKKNYPSGLIISSIHIPLVLHGIRLLIERGLVPDAVVVGTMPPNGYIPITGTTVKIPAILNDSKVLLKVRGILRKGGIVIVLIDDYKNGGYSTSILKLAEKVNADILFSLLKLQDDGNIEVDLYDLPQNSFDEEYNINQKVEFIDTTVKNFYGQSNQEYFSPYLHTILLCSVFWNLLRDYILGDSLIILT